MDNQILNTILTRIENLGASFSSFSTKQNEMLKDIKEMKKNIKDLRDDVDTIYTVQQEDHKTLQKQENILNIHTKQLNELIFITENNKDEHIEFDKRISTLESLIS